MTCAYQNFVKALINTSRTLDAISFFRPSYNFNFQDEVPTWAPDLRRPVGGCMPIGSPVQAGVAERQQLSEKFMPLRLRGTIVGHIGQSFDHAECVKGLDRVRLDDLEELGLYRNGTPSTTLSSQLWDVGQPTDTILLSAGYAIFEVFVSAHARDNLGLDPAVTVIFASRDVQAGDLVICAYGGLHPFVVRANPALKLDDGTMMQQFFGPSVVWIQYSPNSRSKLIPGIGGVLQGAGTTDKLSMELGWRRWKPAARVMNERSLGKEEDFQLF
ncbi:hypothetical protein H2198_006476 [Neophaeococcomyces mojaviensis]|uniref:Uncharacterized protein n=1 Tax=Neophaeococcomyces mojaviensis TaxID=3383035 RepID=A0ACC3A2T2_9EURO|nr:hypothetical protein H2198_006476 [Knufia sp. JES_112]